MPERASLCRWMKGNFSNLQLTTGFYISLYWDHQVYKDVVQEPCQPFHCLRQEWPSPVAYLMWHGCPAEHTHLLVQQAHIPDEKGPDILVKVLNCFIISLILVYQIHKIKMTNDKTGTNLFTLRNENYMQQTRICHIMFEEI